MVASVTFRGGETAGSVADRKIETAKQETTGSVGARVSKDSIFTVDNEPKQDTVCFRGSENGEAKKGPSTTTVVLGTLAAVAATVGLLGLAHKNGWTNKLGDGKIKEYAEKAAEPCYKACKWVKNNSYDKIVAYFKK